MADVDGLWNALEIDGLADPLPADNHAYFTLAVARPLTVAVVA